MRLTPPALRRRNIARLKEHRRWLIERGGVENDSASGSESEDAEDSDDETSVPPVRATSIAPPSTTSALTASISRPSASATLRVGSGLVLASQTSTRAALPTGKGPGLGLGSTLLVGEAEGLPDEGIDSDLDGLTSDDGDDSDDETTTGTGVATSTTITAATSSSSLSRTVPTLTAIAHTSVSSSSSNRDAGQTAPPELTSAPSTTRSTAPLTTLLVPASQVDPAPISTTIGGPVQETTARQVLGPQIDVGETTMNGGAVAGVVFGVLGSSPDHIIYQQGSL